MCLLGSEQPHPPGGKIQSAAISKRASNSIPEPWSLRNKLSASGHGRDGRTRHQNGGIKISLIIQ